MELEDLIFSYLCDWESNPTQNMVPFIAKINDDNKRCFPDEPNKYMEELKKAAITYNVMNLYRAIMRATRLFKNDGMQNNYPNNDRRIINYPNKYPNNDRMQHNYPNDDRRIINYPDVGTHNNINNGINTYPYVGMPNNRRTNKYTYGIKKRFNHYLGVPSQSQNKIYRTYDPDRFLELA